MPKWRQWFCLFVRLSWAAMQTTQSITQANQRELELGHIGGYGSSWHDKYANSSYIFVGNLPFELTEGDLLVVFEQYGRIADVHLVRDQETGKSKGFAFIGYEDQRSTILAVDNFNGIVLLGRVLRVDHVAHYKKRVEDEQTHSEPVPPTRDSLVQERVERELGRYIRPVSDTTTKSADDTRQARVLAQIRKRRMQAAEEEEGGNATR